ncbi:hypothetical protein FOMA001_g14580 [Fusarium oxysporum f. sp. matthiolae]|nr:hypothetical protein FOMA001_g14580 [Fusarium oxysporum f. sp. matthiolae]
MRLFYFACALFASIFHATAEPVPQSIQTDRNGIRCSKTISCHIHSCGGTTTIHGKPSAGAQKLCTMRTTTIAGC